MSKKIIENELTYEALRAIICPVTSWIDKVKQDQGREELNAILDTCIEVCKLEKKQSKQLRRAFALKELMDICRKNVETNKASPRVYFKTLEEIWHGINVEVRREGFEPQYDVETDRVVLVPKKMASLTCPF